MKIISRPKIEQPCAEVVDKCLQLLSPAAVNANPQLHACGMSETEHRLQLILRTLCTSSIIKSFRVGTPRELSNSTYELEKWSRQLSFTGDGVSWYLAELAYEFRR